MIIDNKKLILAIALIILIIGSISNIYVYATQLDKTVISINEKEYTIDQIFFITEPKALDSLNFSGVALDDLINKSGVAYPNKHEYTIIGADGYQKTVDWENIKNGLLTYEKMVVFSDLPKSFRVRDIIEIEVI